MSVECVSQQRSPTSIVFIPHMVHEQGESWWNDIDRVKPKNSEKNLSTSL